MVIAQPQRTLSQDTIKIIKAIEHQLARKKVSISEVLTDSSYMSLHSLLSFREVARQFAKNEKIKIAAGSEAGTRIHVKGTVVNLVGDAESSKLVYFYQTSDKGWYADTAVHISENEGDRKHARLFGYVITDVNGNFEFETIKPKGYPNSVLPGHIHLEITLEENNVLITELQFDDDPRLTGTIRTRSLREHFLIAKNQSTTDEPVYLYTIVTRN